MWRGKGHCRKAGSSLADWPAHCADTRAKRNKIHGHSWLPPIQSWQRKNPSNKLTQSLAKEDHADPCMACSSLEMKPEQQLRSRSSPTSEHQRLRKLPRRGSRGVKFRHGLAPGQKKSVIMTSFFDGIVQIVKKSLGRIWHTSSITEAPRRGAMRGMSL